MNDPLAVKVRIRNGEGKYLTGGLNSGFSEDPSKAIIFDYLRHQVAEQLDELRRTRGILLEAVPVSPAEVYEICDQCRNFASPFDTFFDGSRFLCFECFGQASVVADAQLSHTASSAPAFTTNSGAR